MQRITILRAGVERLHARFDHTGETNRLMHHKAFGHRPMEGVYTLERHCGIHGNKAGNGTDSEGDAAGQGLSRAGTALHELLESGVRRESNG